MSQVSLTRLFEFSASHRCYRPEWSKEKNQQVFGPAVNDHGHNYLLEVTVTGPVNANTGMIMNVTDLKATVNDVLREFDHRNINEDTPYFAQRVPTTENIAIVLWSLIGQKLNGTRLTRLRLWEDEDLFVDYTGNSASQPVAYLSRRYKFSAAHRLYSHDLSPEQNERVYSKCANPKGHGHNYELIVTVAGKVDEATGMCVDLVDLDRVVHEQVVSRYDHRNLNTDVEDFLDLVPTGENIARRVWERLSQALPAGRLKKVKLIETRNNFFEFTADPSPGLS